MKTTIEMQFNDLRLFLTEEDRNQIKAMPVPSLEQAKMMKKTWQDFYGDKVVSSDDKDEILNAYIWIKPFMKCFDEYPEMFV